MHFHRMLLFWLMTTARGLGCGAQDGVSQAGPSHADVELVAAEGTAKLDASVGRQAAPAP